MKNVKKNRAGLNRGVPMDRSIQIMEGNFRRGENTEVLTFSTRHSVQHSPLCKINGETSRICMKLPDWMFGKQSSIGSSSILKNYIVCLKLHFRFVD